MEIYFDLDGTLIDISERYYHLYKDLVIELGKTPLAKRSYWSLKRSRIRDEKILYASNINKNEAKVFLDLFKNRVESEKYLSLDKVFPYTEKVLNILSENNDLYLISYRNNSLNGGKQLQKLGLDQKFIDIKIGRLGNEGYKTKVEYVTQLTKGGQILLVGDTDDEILAAKELGATSLAVLSGIRNKSYLERLSPDYISQDIRSIPKIINRLTSSLP